MARRMLIDTAHPEETRVVVVNGNRIEEFDFEAAAKKPLKGNIYLAKVTRVEPSLQAAFIDYGGNRHGFLAFSEIHPDYYQIPVADRQVLVAAQNSEARAAAREEDRLAGDSDVGNATDDTDAPSAALSEESGSQDAAMSQDAGSHSDEETTVTGDFDGASEDTDEAPATPRAEITEVPTGDVRATAVETAGSDDLDDALEEARGRRALPYGRPYKIQEVIKRRQILLVQVVKEERGNKGAALTTYLSLAGRYCVLMPNTARGGGISRKITSQTDRKRLKSAAAELEIPNGMGLIVRTAGANRTKAEIKRDYEYLIRVWETVRDLTLKSTAPALVYEEGKLIKRAIRDLYSKEIEAILVDGEEGYKEAKNFMRTLMPSHAKAVQHYKDRVPLFQRFQIESLLDQMFNPVVTLRSGGYIVINQTEALVSVDVNSGRSTREHSIEDTATRTNLEAAEEVARQLRLRDLAGLIVIDFIDMEDGRNNRSVEKRLKDSLKNDRARIQIGRISSFGLLEMSRQRLRAGVLEGSTHRCPNCDGSGIVRSVESAALRALRGMEEEGLKDRTSQMTVRLPTPVALYILNHKRPDLLAVEERYACTCVIEADSSLPASGLVIERTITREAQLQSEPVSQAARYDFQVEIDSDDEDIEEPAGEDEDETAETERKPEARADEDGGRRRKRRKRRRGGRGREESAGEAGSIEASGDFEHEAVDDAAANESDSDDETEGASAQPAGETSEDDMARRRRRRGRRGGRRNRRRDGAPAGEQSDQSASPSPDDKDAPQESLDTSRDDEMEHAEPSHEGDSSSFDAPAPVFEEPVQYTPPTESAPTSIFGAYQGDTDTATLADEDDEPAEIGEPSGPEQDREEISNASPSNLDAPARKGWWQRRFGN